MADLGPWDAPRQVAVAVSGGADSMALCLLAASWGTARALIVDHGLRAEAAAEAAATAARLRERGIGSQVITLRLTAGPGVAERARAGRIAALQAACEAAGLADLLLAHHAGDQAETVLMRARHGSAAAGLAGMAPVRALGSVRLLRPLLLVPPSRLRATLLAAGMAWVEDPSNQDSRAERVRVRRLLAWADGTGPASVSLQGAGAFWSLRRSARARDVAAELAASATIRPEGFAVLRHPVSQPALAALVQAIGGGAYPPSPASVDRLGAAWREGRSATLAGVRLMPAGRLGPGHLLVREPAACAAPVRAGVAWDGRFRPSTAVSAPDEGCTIGALGDSARLLRRHSPLPSVVLRGLPAWRRDEALLAVPHLCYPDEAACRGRGLHFRPSALASQP